MNSSKIIKHMCINELTSADINAICKARNFSSKEMKNRNILENILLSDQGLDKIFSLLSKEEIILLHLMKKDPEPVDVTFFECIYGDTKKNKGWNGTFNQEYKEIFNKTKNSLVRRGILFFSEENFSRGKNTKLERIVFYFPLEFHKYLPPPFENIKETPGKGDHNNSFIINKLHEITDRPDQSAISNSKTKNFKLKISDGRLSMGNSVFSVEKIKKWQHSCWVDAVKPHINPKGYSEKIVGSVRYALLVLNPGQWIGAEELEPIVKIFCYYRTYSWNEKEDLKFDIEQICALGWKTGCLEKKKFEKKILYRFAQEYAPDSAVTDFKNFLQPDKKMTLIINLDLIPLTLLEELGAISDFKVSDLNVPGSSLTAKPNFIRFGRIDKDLWQGPLFTWLRENVPAYEKVLQKLESRWGKQIIHKNLLIARISDLGLKMTIKKQFSHSSKLVFLPNDYIAFPKYYLEEIEDLVKKSGFVVKNINARENKNYD